MNANRDGMVHAMVDTFGPTGWKPVPRGSLGLETRGTGFQPVRATKCPLDSIEI